MQTLRVLLQRLPCTRDEILQLALQLHEAHDVLIALLFISTFLQDNDTGVDVGLDEPTLQLGLNDGQDFVVLEEKLLQPLAVAHIQPGIADNEAKAPAIGQKLRAVDKEVDVDARPFTDGSDSLAVLIGRGPLDETLFVTLIAYQVFHPLLPGVRRVTHHAVEMLRMLNLPILATNTGHVCSATLGHREGNGGRFLSEKVVVDDARVVLLAAQVIDG